MSSQTIENHGVIGDLHTVALVGIDGTIDFLCLPRLDSPSVFARLLDRKGGCFSITPQLDGARNKQLYLTDSNILLTRFLAEDGVVEISDFMSIADVSHVHVHDLIRRVKVVRGEVSFRMHCEPRFDYGRASHRLEMRGGEVWFLPEAEGVRPLRLRAEVPLGTRDGAAVAEFKLAAGEHASFVLEETETADTPSSSEDYVSNAFKDTMNYWRHWVARSTYRGRWREMVTRSALTLKLLTSRPYGSIAAAATFGLPEQLGGERNWDYRYAWIRDASFTLYGLMRLGYTEEAGEFMNWIEARCGELEPDGSLQVMYGLDGRHDLSEEVLPHLEGYCGSKPVRIGNGAYDQLQLDIYGELMDSVYLYNKYGSPISYDLWSNLTRLVNWVCEHWHEPDEGIWEVRGGRHEFLYSRLMCWVALDRAIRLSRARSFPAPRQLWFKTRDDIYRDIMESFWDPRQKAFMQYRGANALDAASLMMPLVRFIGPTDPRWLSTLEAIERDLVDDSLVRRYKRQQAAPDGLEGREGTFNMCTFWYAECLSRSGDLQKARFVFDKMLGYANHLGLYAEELGGDGTQLGNFPQAFTHLGLISAAYNLDQRLSASRTVD